MTNEWFTNEKYRRNCISKIYESGYETEIWNVNKVVFKEAEIPEIPNDLYSGTIPVKNFNSQEELRNALRKNQKYSLILNWYADWSATFDICAEKVRYCNIYAQPIFGKMWLDNLAIYNENWLTATKRKLQLLFKNLQQNNNTLKKKYELNVIKKWPPIYNFLATPAEFFPLCRLASKNTLKFIHAINYDYYILDKDKSPKDNGYILFIDDAWGSHPEDKLLDSPLSQKEVEYYYILMDKLFILLENHYNQKVIIAAHPKAQYNGNEFNHREIRQFQTYELIKNSSFVIQHISSSIDWCFLFNKPCLSVTYDKMDAFKHMHENMLLFESYCGCQKFNMEHDSNPWNFLFYNKQVYQKYLHDFVFTNEYNTRLFMEIVLDEIKDMFMS